MDKIRNKVSKKKTRSRIASSKVEWMQRFENIFGFEVMYKDRYMAYEITWDQFKLLNLTWIKKNTEVGINLLEGL